jgi:hypothetical protein
MLYCCNAHVGSCALLVVETATLSAPRGLRVVISGISCSSFDKLRPCPGATQLAARFHATVTRIFPLRLGPHIRDAKCRNSPDETIGYVLFEAIGA